MLTRASRQAGCGTELVSESGVGRAELSQCVALKWGRPVDEALGLQADKAVRYYERTTTMMMLMMKKSL